ncbi:MAG: histidine phosphatase family protein [Pseudomonadota bacterium]
MHFPHTLYFIRHGETDWNRAGRLQGQTEIDLNETGRSQAKRNGEVLKDFLTADLIQTIPIVSSPMRRVQQTLKIVLDEIGRSSDVIETDDRLKEISFGEMEGYTPAEMKAAHPALHRQRKTDKWTFTPPGGESYETFSMRVGDWLRTIETDTVVVAHGGVSRVVRAHLHDMSGPSVVELPTPQDKIMVMSGNRMDLI